MIPARRGPGTTGLPGTNVLTVVRPDLDAGTGVYYIVSYRYHAGQRRSGRSAASRSATPDRRARSIKTVGVAHEIPAPPPGWDPSMAPTHAVECHGPQPGDPPPDRRGRRAQRSRAATVQVRRRRPLGRERAPASGLQGGLTNPSAPPSRCGGRMALVLDTSGSMPASNGGIPLRDRRRQLHQRLQRHPVLLVPQRLRHRGLRHVDGRTDVETNGVRAPFMSVLNGGAPVAAMKSGSRTSTTSAPTATTPT